MCVCRSQAASTEREMEKTAQQVSEVPTESGVCEGGESGESRGGGGGEGGDGDYEMEEESDEDETTIQEQEMFEKEGEGATDHNTELEDLNKESESHSLTISDTVLTPPTYTPTQVISPWRSCWPSTTCNDSHQVHQTLVLTAVNKIHH